MRSLRLIGTIVDLKKKFEETKEKYKKHAPAIIAIVSTGVAVGLAVANHRLKTELENRCDAPADKSHLYTTDETDAKLREGGEIVVPSLSHDFHITIQKKEKNED